MSQAAVVVEDIHKEYLLGATHARATTFRDALHGALTAPIRQFRTLRGQVEQAQRFEALRGVSFEVAHGEVLGIIGRNGAGKSTLLKILSRVTAPTRGRVVMRGSVGSLLEVGTGFHPELTGRENVFLNGAILGMSRADIRQRFDAIVEYAGVSAFLDTPVKRYSSGMQVRLAFAVSAHLDPDILLVDEVLAVGDAAFQRKCLSTMSDVASQGRTVLVVSHQLDVVQALCTRCVMFEAGQLVMDGSPSEVIEHYGRARMGGAFEGRQYTCIPDPSMPVQILSAQMLEQPTAFDGAYDVFDPIAIALNYEVREPVEGAIVVIEIVRNGVLLLNSFDADTNPALLQVNGRQPGRYRSTIRLPHGLLRPGAYAVGLKTGIANTTTHQYAEQALRFDVELRSREGTFVSYAAKRPGTIACPLDWQTEMGDVDPAAPRLR